MSVPRLDAVGSVDTIEILSVSLLDEERSTVGALRALDGELGIGFGWHYLLDLAWILRQMGGPPGTVLDAGAGTGIIQWYLSDLGWSVVSVDRTTREHLPQRFRRRYAIRGLRRNDLAPPPIRSRPWLRRVARTLARARRVPGLFAAMRPPLGPRRSTSPGARASSGGEVVIYNQDLRHLVDIEDGSVDEVVSVSALEHNRPEDLPIVVTELLRVLKPGGRLIATLGASRTGDWFHEPSRGWCYSEATLRRAFGIDSSAPSNYEQFDELFERLRTSRELREGLAGFYFRSGSNGMPWGKWDPQYQSVGVCKVKS